MVLPIPEVADRLAGAAWTTLGLSSAVAAMVATAVLHRRPSPARPAARVTLRAFLLAALLAALVAAAGTAVLVGNGLLDAAALQFTVSSAALGAGLAARRWARTRRRTPVTGEDPS